MRSYPKSNGERSPIARRTPAIVTITRFLVIIVLAAGTLLLDLKRRGIGSAYVVLHAGLSSYLDDEVDRQHPASE